MYAQQTREYDYNIIVLSEPTSLGNNVDYINMMIIIWFDNHKVIKEAWILCDI